MSDQETEERLRAAKELAETASKRKSEFVASLSHDLRAPLNTVLGMTELLGETPLTPRQRRYIETLEHAGEHMLSLIEDVLDLARIEAGHVTLEDAPFDVHEVVESAIEMMRVHARRKKLELIWSVAPDVPRVLRGDARRLRQVLVNLLGNAVKFTAFGRVTLTVGRHPAVMNPTVASLRFAVMDTGIGIPSDKIQSIFGGFVQGDESISRRYGGFGLGLDIAKRIVDRMGGRIWAETLHPNGGAAFFVTAEFPAEVGTRQTPLAPVRQSAADLRLHLPDDRKLRVLVVDDSPDNRVLLGEYLDGAGADVGFADDGPSALSMAQATRYDVVLMDLQMPHLDGYDTTRELLRLLRSNGIVPPPIIALSAHALPETFVKSREAGCALHLTKPIRKRVLLETLAQVCGARLSERPPSREVSDDLAPLLPQYFANRKSDVVVIDEALARGDFSVIATVAHNMRGTGASYGFPELSELGGKLEEAAKRQSVETLAALARELHDIVASLLTEVALGKRKKSGTHLRAQSAPDVGELKGRKSYPG